MKRLTRLLASTRAGRFAASYLKDRRGVAAIEFAFIMPVLVILYMGTNEVAGAIDANKRVGRISSLVGDLVTQSPKLTTAEIDAIMQIGSKTIYPYVKSAPSMQVVAIQITDETNPKAKVVWSRGSGAYPAKPYAKDTILTDVPADLMTRGAFLVRATTGLQYVPVVNWRNLDINMEETYYLRPRQGQSLCTNCPA